MDKMREEFEAWCASVGLTLMDNAFNNGYYAMGYGWQEWNAWKASRAALCVELPSFENGSIRGYSGDCDEARMIVDSVAESLDKAGVSCK